MSSWSCACGRTYDEHSTVVQTNAERQASGKLTNTPWMEAAVTSGLPTAHMGGISGFTALADGVDRAMAGLEPGFEPEIIDGFTTGVPAYTGSIPLATNSNRSPHDRFIPRGPMARTPTGQRPTGSSATNTRNSAKNRSFAQRPEWQD
jgi:hypothetical protein